MASVNAIYGLVIAVIIAGKISPGGSGYRVYEGFAHLSAGLVCGLCSLGGGYAVGSSGEGVTLHISFIKLHILLLSCLYLRLLAKKGRV